MILATSASRRFAAAAAGATLSIVLAAGAFAQAQQQQRPAQGQQQRPAQQQQQPAQPEPVAPRQITGITNGWVKLCQRIDNTEREGCMITVDVRAPENGAFIASAAVQELQGEARRQLVMQVPLGMALQAGLLVRVDQERAVPAKFGTCLENGCFAGIDLGTDFLAQMRRGQNMFITVRNAQGLALDLTLPLRTFMASYDGPATDIRVVQEQQRRLEEELTRRAEEARQRLLQQQGGGAQQPAAPAAPRQ
jgi:invasion protein IalB